MRPNRTCATFLALLASIAFSACASASPPPPPEPPQATLFQSDRAVMDDASVERALAFRFRTLDSSRIVIYQTEVARHAQFQSRARYWQHESFKDPQQQHYAVLRDSLRAVPSVLSVGSVSALLMPPSLSLPHLREAAARLNADLVLIYTVRNEVYQKVRLFKPDRLKAYATCEALLYDVRSGVIPFSTLVTRHSETEKGGSDLNESEARMRAENEAVTLALNGVATEAATFLRTRSR